MTIRRRAASLLLVVVSFVGGCSGDTESPMGPTAVATVDVTTVSGGSWSGGIIVGDGSTTAFNMTLIGRGLGQGPSVLALQAPGTIEVTGSFDTASGLKGTVQGVLQGTLQNGSFDGWLTADSPACTRRYAGPITESTVAWIPQGPLPSGCPLTFSVQLPRPRGPDCQYAVSLNRQTFSGNGGSGELRITTGAGCTWAAESLDSWLVVEDLEPRIGSGRVTFTARPNEQDGREGRLRVAIANQTFIIEQGAHCTYGVSPRTVAVPAAGGTAAIAVTAAAGCEWNAQSAVPWVAVSPTVGNGSGTVTISASPSNGPSRTGTISVAGETITVSQGGGCEVVVTPATVTAPAAGRAGSLQVSAAAGCQWTTQSSVPWIVLASPGGDGPGVVNFNVQANTGSERPGTISINGVTVAVTQASGCTYNVTSTQPPAVAQAGGTSTVTVMPNNPSCTWRAAIDSVPPGGGWLRFSGLPSPIVRTGTSSFDFIVDANNGTPTIPAVERTGQIVLTGDGAITVMIVIRQLGAPVVEVVPPPPPPPPPGTQDGPVTPPVPG